MALTHRQRRFVQEYLRSETATEAALRAGYASSSAAVMACRMMDDPDILAAIEEGQKKRLDRVAVDADYLLTRLHEEVEADIADLYDEETGDLLPVHEWPEVWRRGLVAGVEIEVLFDGSGKDRQQIGHLKKIKTSDRTRRIEALGRHVSVAAFRDSIKVEGLEGLAERLARISRAKAADGGVTAAPPAKPAPSPEPGPEKPAREPEFKKPETTPESDADWQKPAPSYTPVLPWPDRPATVAVEYDPTGGAYDFTK
jgi:phage terminase small subunit